MTRPNINITVSGPSQGSRVYSTVVLKPNASAASQMFQANTKYVVRWTFDFAEGVFELPEGCILEFDGGQFINAYLRLNGAAVLPSYNCLETDGNVLMGSPCAGTYRWDSDAGRPLWFNGSSWVDALGNDPSTSYQDSSSDEVITTEESEQTTA